MVDGDGTTGEPADGGGPAETATAAVRVGGDPPPAGPSTSGTEAGSTGAPSAAARSATAPSEQPAQPATAPSEQPGQPGQPATAPSGQPAVRPHRRPRRWFRYTLPGLSVALVVICLSFTPSLLPRSGLLQGLLSGITGAIGYGLGVSGAYVWRLFADRPARPARRRSWRVLAVVAAVALAVSIGFGLFWQHQLRDLMAMPGAGIKDFVLIPVLFALSFTGLVALGRALRSLFRWLMRQLARVIGPRAARDVAWAAVVVGTALVVSGVVLEGLSNAANAAFSVKNDTTDPGIQQPTAATRSGGPGSLVAWDSLGRQGRNFVGKGPTEAQIAAFTGRPAEPPIRAYAGLKSADSSERRAALAVDDLARAGGFDRQYLLVATTTGSGWLDPGNISAFEYETGGDSAIVAMQYSYLPSWISYLVDQSKARQAGRDLFDAVYERWSQLPPDHRPKLLVAGESLGSFGSEAAFSGEADLRNRTAGALYTGPPNFNTLHLEFTQGRDPGTPEIEPVYRGGRTIRFSDDIATGIPPGAAWNGTRILYLQHSSDPIVWWSPHLLFTKPDWLSEPRGPDVLPAFHWFPILTFWQVTADLPFSTGVPDGHGHVYTKESVQGWATVLQPPGWTAADTERLQAVVAKD